MANVLTWSYRLADWSPHERENLKILCGEVERVNDTLQQRRLLLSSIGGHQLTERISKTVGALGMPRIDNESVVHMHAATSELVLVWHKKRQELAVIKQHIHVKRSQMAHHVLDELCMYLLVIPFIVRNEMCDESRFATLKSATITADDTCIELEHVPLSFYNVFKRTNEVSRHYVVTVAIQLFQTLAAMHASSYAHRDVKADNLRFRADGSLVLVDFDSAGAFEKDTGLCFVFPVTTCTTRPPELLRHNEDSEEIIIYDARALDVWSAGCVIAQMMNDGLPLYPGTDTATVRRQVAQSFLSFAQPSSSSSASSAREEQRINLPRRVTRRLGTQLTTLLTEHVLRLDAGSRWSAQGILDELQRHHHHH